MNRSKVVIGSPLYYCANDVNQYTATDDEADTCPDPSTPTETFDCDEDGNLTADGDYTYKWDAENRLTRVWLVDPNPNQDENGDERLNFTYDYLGRRVRKVLEHYDGNDWVTDLDRRFVWYNWLMLLELECGTGVPPVIRKYTWGLDLAGLNGGGTAVSAVIEGVAGTLDPLASRQGQVGGLLALHDPDDDGDPNDPNDIERNYVCFYDANGNVGQLIDWENDGTLVAKYEYDPYGGNLLDPTDPQESGLYAADNPIRFSTKYLDAETALGYWGYRYYSPQLGRWLSRDPIEEDGGQNLYGYVFNTPTTAVDPQGEFLWGCSCNPCPLPPPATPGNCSDCWTTCTSPAGQAMAAGALGIVICRPDGCRCACVNLARLPTNPLARRIIQTCVLQHEECHVNDDPDFAQCPPNNCGPMVVGPRGGRGPQNAAAECTCYGTELQCLAAGRGNCGANPACQQVVDQRVDFLIRSMCQVRQCPISSYVASLPPSIQQRVNAICPPNRR